MPLAPAANEISMFFSDHQKPISGTQSPLSLGTVGGKEGSGAQSTEKNAEPVVQQQVVQKEPQQNTVPIQQ